MQERIVSPGVYTRERDQSFLAQGIGEIGGAFIGPTPKGPAFIPTIVRSQRDYVTTFGDANVDHYTGLTVKNYLREAGVATVVRVLGLDGWDSSTTQAATIYALDGSGVPKLFAVLFPSSKGNSIGAISLTGPTSSTNFDLTVSSSGGIENIATGLSADPSDQSYIGRYFGTSPKTSKAAYVYAIFPDLSGGTEIDSAALSTTVLNFSGSTYGRYSNAHTPWIRSQKFGSESVDLFKLHTLSDGNSANTEIKASILNIKPSGDVDYPYGTFSLLIRRYNDVDNRVEVLEQYDNLTLDPDSPTFIARVIGDSAPTEDVVTGEMFYQGDFPNNSQYVYVEMSPDSIREDALPFGFGQIDSTVSVNPGDLITPNRVTNRWVGGVDKKFYYGWDFGTSNGTNTSYLAPLPSGSVSVPGSDFDLGTISEPQSGIAGPITLADEWLGYRKFTVPFQGGFDGLNPARDIALGGDITPTNTQGFNISTTTAPHYAAYKRAIDAISNPDQWDFNLIVLPGVIYEYHSAVASDAINLCEERGDAFYIMDSTGMNATLDTATAKAGELDTNYAGVYYPWLRTIDVNTNKLLWVPPSVILPEIYAYNDNISAEWFAPAGFNRGGIPSAVGVKHRLSQPSRDTLYEGKVNPIAQFPGQGIVVWGQKTLQRRASALDRINVRRLMIRVKKYIASTSRYLVFEQNVEATRNRFLNMVNPYLASVAERSGIYAWRAVMDLTNNTPDIIDRNILYAQLWIQPTKSAEMIIIDFNITPTGASFTDV